MTEVTSRRRSTAFLIIKILVVLSFPLFGGYNPPRLEWISLLFHVNNFTNIIITLDLALLLGLLVMLPCLVFEYQINSKPLTTRVRGRAALACMLSWTLSMMVDRVPTNQIAMYSNAIDCVLPLSIAFFVILPLINRESTIRWTLPEYHSVSYRLLRSIQRKQFRRETILSGLLWIGVVFCPFVLYLSWEWVLPYIEFLSLYSNFTFTSYGVFWFLLGGYQLNFVAWTVYALPVIALMSSIRFVFVKYIFGFQNGSVSRSRLVSIAILGELFPPAMLTLSTQVTAPPSAYVPLFYPVPILPILGFLYIKLSKVEPLKQELWPEYEHRMWFDSERDPMSPKPVDDSIEVPLIYLIVSQVRKRWNK